MEKTLSVVGAGLAGVEAAWAAARLGARVRLYEMRPQKLSPAHTTGLLGELVCSNSLKSEDPLSAQGLLKQELRHLGSVVMSAADAARLPGGKALAVDRARFAQFITEKLSNHPNIEVIRQEVKELPEPPVVIATGPLSSGPLLERVQKLVGRDFLFFYDAISPVVERDSLDTSRMFWADRFGNDPNSYLNIPLTREEYTDFWEKLVSAQVHIPHLKEDEKARYFEGCLPIEVIAKRGFDALAYGPMRPTGFPVKAYAVVQLRPENQDASALGLVGFQTQLRISEQKRVFRGLPGMENARFLRYGAVHRNTYINAPGVLGPDLQMIGRPGVFIAGQLAGTEGYMEAAAGGLVAGLNAVRPGVIPPEHTAIGTLLRALVHGPARSFQPVHFNFGLFEDVPRGLRSKARKEFVVQRAKEQTTGFRPFD